MTSTILRTQKIFRFPRQQVFDYYVQASEMSSYRGFFLIPGIQRVETSDLARKTGTRNLVFNTDGSRHRSLTVELESPRLYRIHIDAIQSQGWKSFFAHLIQSIDEVFIFEECAEGCLVDRTFQINHSSEWWVKIYMHWILKPQFMRAFQVHFSDVAENIFRRKG